DHGRRGARRPPHRSAGTAHATAGDGRSGMSATKTSEGKIPAIVLGGTGYVAGELLRLIVSHPRVELKAVLSDSQPGESIARSSTHLAPVYPDLKFASLDEVKQLVATLPQAAILSAAPHGVAAKLI